MDLGIAGRSALVCASSKTLGKACATSLARAGVNVVMNGRTAETLEAAAREVASRGVTLNGMLPGPIDTDRLRSAVRFVAEKAGRSFEEEFAVRCAENPTGRVSDPVEFGALCAFLCSVQAGFINGQNVVIDGGAFPGTL